MAPTTYAPAPGHGARRRRALLIGCSYPGSSAQLNGCINDVQCIQFCLKKRFGFTDQQILVLRDDQRHPDFISTKANIYRVRCERGSCTFRWPFAGKVARGKAFRRLTGQEPTWPNWARPPPPDSQCEQHLGRALHRPVPVLTLAPHPPHPQGIQWLMADQQPGDSLFFHFSGHGSQQYDRNGDEEVSGAATLKPEKVTSQGDMAQHLCHLGPAPAQPRPALTLPCLR